MVERDWTQITRAGLEFWQEELLGPGSQGGLELGV